MAQPLKARTALVEDWSSLQPPDSSCRESDVSSLWVCPHTTPQTRINKNRRNLLKIQERERVPEAAVSRY